MSKLYYNVTTLLKFTGSFVGIVRQDYETARRIMGLKGCTFVCFKDGTWHEVDTCSLKRAICSFERLQSHSKEIWSKAKPSNVSMAPDSILITLGLDWDHLDLEGLEKLVQKGSLKLISNFNDAIVIRNPIFAHSDAQVQQLRHYFSLCFQHALFVNCISKTAKNDAIWLSKNLGVSLPSMLVNPLGFDTSSVRLTDAKQRPKKPYCIFVSSFERRKNHQLLLNVYKRSVEPEALPNVLFCGRDAGTLEDIRAQLDRTKQLSNKITILEGAPDSQVQSYLQNADFVIFPSLHEGWGLGVSEAMSIGKLVVASDIQALRESSQDLAIFLDPHDTKSWEHTLKMLYQNKKLKKKQEELIQSHFVPRTWDQYFNCFSAALGRHMF